MRPTIPLAAVLVSTCGAGRRVRHALMAAAVVMLAACGGDGGPIGTAANGSIRGAVTDNTGAAVANVAVALTGNAQAARTANSGADGVYTFADLPPGTYTLAVTPPAGFIVGAAGTASVTVAGGAQANPSPLVLGRAGPDTCAIARPDFGGPATAADRALFAYDASAPLNLKKTVDSTRNGVEFNTISYSSPDGGLVPGIMYQPVGRAGPRPGVVVMHPSGNATAPVKGAKLAMFEVLALAQRGAVVIAIDAPYFRRGGSNPPTLTAQDRPEQIQLMKDLQRAVDVLLAQEDVDPARIGFTGYSYGGMVGVHFAGIERRLKAAVITAGYGGSVTAATNANLLQYLSTVSCATRNAWFRDNTPIEPIRFISGASPTALLFQIARYDAAVLLEDAQAAYDAASSPREALYYDTGHGLNPQATADRFAWLHKQIGIDP
jgi:dienelactone hydrolase